MVDFTTVDDYYVVTVDDPFGMSFAFCEFAEIEPDEEVTDMDNELTDDEDEIIEEDDDDDKPDKKKKIKVIRKNKGDGFDYLWLIIGGGIAAIIIAAGIVIFLILKKKNESFNLNIC